MTASRAVPLFGLAFIVCAVLMLGTVISRSPYTHANLSRTLGADYDRTGVATIGEADPEAIRAELEELPRLAREAPADRRLAVNTVGLQTPGDPENVERYALGKALFTQKCTGCHSIGGGRRVGPDLKAITGQRGRDWLIQFVLAPDKVIASGDPIATLLLNAYAVPMPNLSLTRPQVEALLVYIEGKSADPSARQATAGGGPAQQDGSSGKSLFEQKCASCHSLGGGKLLGPDLKGTSAKRSRDWLIGFILAPDSVIASGDATASQLVKEYGMPMPNLGITRPQAEALLDYIDGNGASDSTQQTTTTSGARAAPGAQPTSAPSVAPTVQATPVPSVAPTRQATSVPSSVPTKQETSVANATVLEQDTSAGKKVFEQKCAGCHSIGSGKLVGPDLKGISAKRPTDWLIEFIVAPDKLIGSGDATAAQLVKEYGMPMPNLGVSKADAEQILAYLQVQ